MHVKKNSKRLYHRPPLLQMLAVFYMDISSTDICAILILNKAYAKFHQDTILIQKKVRLIKITVYCHKKINMVMQGHPFFF